MAQRIDYIVPRIVSEINAHQLMLEQLKNKIDALETKSMTRCHESGLRTMQTEIAEMVSSRVAAACRDMIPVSNATQSDPREQLEAIANTENKLLMLEARLKDIEAKVAVSSFSSAQIHRLVDQITHIEMKLSNITKALEVGAAIKEPTPMCLSHFETRVGSAPISETKTDASLMSNPIEEPAQTPRQRASRAPRATRRKLHADYQANSDEPEIITIE